MIFFDFGYENAKLNFDIAKKFFLEAKKMDVNMPMVDSLHRILYQGSSSDELIQDLLDHPNEVDVEFTYKD